MTERLLMVLALGASGYAAAALLVPALVRVLADGGFVGKNFRGRPIPKGMGVAVPLATLPPLALMAWMGAPISLILMWLALQFGMAFLGLFDDAAGDRRHGGFREHFRALLAGRVTTGALKALYGGGLALLAGWALTGTLPRALLAGAVIALAANAINLLDVRPGRALKGFALLAGAGVCGIALWNPPAPWHWFHLAAGAAVAGAGAALLGGDLRGEHMLGDAGSNLFGSVGGLLLAAGPLWWQGVWALLLVAMHLYAERRSLTRAIEGVKLLDLLDRWGRPKDG